MENKSPSYSETKQGIFLSDSRLFRHIAPALVVCIGIALSVLLFMTTEKIEDDRIKAGFEQEAQNRFASFKNISDNYLQELEALKAFYAATEKVTRAEFRVFTKELLSHFNRTQALEWIPRVPDTERAAFEAEARREGLPDFQITERTAQGVMVKADRRQEYFPVYFIEPFKGNEAALGNDLASEPLKLAALNYARDTEEVIATAGIKPVQGKGESYSVLILQPVYRKGLPADSIEAKRNNLEGFVLGAFRLGDLLEEAMSSFVPAGIDIYLYDISANDKENILYFHTSRVRAAQTSPVSNINELTKGLHYSGSFEMAGRKWLALFIPTPDYISSKKTWDAWWFLAGGILVTGLLAGYIKLITGQTAQARQYSSELFKAKEGLEHEATEHKKTEEAMRNSEERFKALTESTSDWIWAVNENAVYTYASPKIKDLLGYEPKEVIGKTPFDFMSQEEARRVAEEFGEIVKARRPIERLENVNLHKNGHFVVLETSGVPISDAEGYFRGYRGIDRDITERKKMEDRIVASLEEKEILLREIHHRVKNNMTVIYSLLDLQSKFTSERHDREMLNDAKARIKAMALIHEKLYRSKDMAKIDFSDYLRDILNNMFMSYLKDPGRIALNIEVRDVDLGIDDAIPCGLIINELASNSLKHAFPDDRTGEITVGMRPYDNDMIELIVADNGIGLPADLDSRKKASMGLSLVDALVNQLNGKIELHKDEGTKFRITFMSHK